ncbi:MAG: TldD/PmbA family protein [Dehalococcoidales bacterium]|nr:TldD/PmbA family protein [Dehalococcoidales bacterium]
MEELLALARKSSEEAEVYQVSLEETQVLFESNRLKQLQSGQTTAVTLRLIKNGRLGCAIATSTEDIRRLVAHALETAAFGSEAKFSFPEAQEYPRIGVFDKKVSAVSIATMVRLGEQMIAAITAHTPGILCSASIVRGVMEMRLINSRGANASYRKSFFSLSLEGTLIRGTDMLFVGDSASSCHPVLDTGEITAKVSRQLELAREIAKAPTRKLPVVFTPDGVISLITPLMTALNGKTVLEGASPLGDKLGKPVFDRKFSLRDDPLVPYRTQSRPCDDEGVPSRRTPLVSRGVVKNFIYDLMTAAKAGKQSTGHGSRGRGGLPSPSPSALVITPGKATFNEMVADIKEGLVVEQLMGADQGNILGGDFSGNVLLGYKIENGRITGRVKDTMVAGNVYEILKDIPAIGSESKWVGGFLYTPPIYCRGLSVSSKG